MTEQSLNGWRAKFDELERCPWPGPRPLRYDDAKSLLCGRDEDLTRFRHEVDTHRLVFLSGLSGVGKTSLLRRGLVPDLKKNGYLVAICRDWGGASHNPTPAAFLAERIEQSLRPDHPELPEDTKIMHTLANDYGERAVIVLDQFEELMRDAREFTDGLFSALGSLNHRTPIKIVISLRSEHLHELRPLEHQVQPFSTSHYFLDAVKPEFAGAVARAGNDVTENSIDSEAADALAELWRTARDAAGTSDSFRDLTVGLLHLQAALYTLHHGAKSGTITLDHVRSLEARVNKKYHGSTADDIAQRIFSECLTQSVDVKLERCDEAAEAIDMNRYLIEGARDALAQTVKHLSSAGFKLVRDARELADSAIGVDLVALRRGSRNSRDNQESVIDGPFDPEQEDALFEVVLEAIRDKETVREGDEDEIDFVAADRRTIAAAADRLAGDVDAPSWVQRLRLTASPFDADPNEVTSGPLMGFSPANVYIEEVRRFALGLEWMRASSLVRISSPTGSDMRVSLVHDGFGTALNDWARDEEDRPEGAIYAMTAPKGAEFMWPSAPGTYRRRLDKPTRGGARILMNLRWQGNSIINTGFRQVVFANCDLRGSIFLRCRFEGVTFVNCLLDGVLFSDCELIGASSNPPREWADDPTPFVISSSKEAAAALSYYRLRTSDERVLADLPGLPATTIEHIGDLREVHPETGSLAIYGGRVSSLAVRRATFTEGARFCLREVAGSGLDVVEHTTAGAYEVTGSALRHVTFTSPPNREERVEPLDIDIFGSAIYQLWIGDDLSGSVVAENCTILSAWNGSPATDMKASLVKACKYHGLVGFEVDDTCEGLIGDERRRSTADFPDEPRLRGAGIAMDYRRNAVDEPGTRARLADLATEPPRPPS